MPEEYKLEKKKSNWAFPALVILSTYLTLGIYSEARHDLLVKQFQDLSRLEKTLEERNASTSSIITLESIRQQREETKKEKEQVKNKMNKWYWNILPVRKQ
jgi:hypothetical protein